MSERSSAKEISLGDGFGEVAVKANGIRIELHADGSVDAYTAGPVKVHPAANDTAANGKTAIEIGDEMEDGTIYAGISPDTHKPIYARPKDESGTYSFNEAAKHAKNIGEGFHVPTKNELNVLYENRNKGKLKGTFNETSKYWSSTPFNFLIFAWAQRFSDGFQDITNTDVVSSLRCVR